MLSQILTLYTTPVVYLYLDRLQRLLSPRRARPHAASRGEDERGASATSEPTSAEARTRRR